MSRADRIRTVVRIRELQERIAESEAAARRIEADRRAMELEGSLHDLLGHRESDTTPSSQAFARRQTELDGALAQMHLRRDVHAAAVRDVDEAMQRVRATHQRHEAVERLLDRAIAAESADEARRIQGEIDDLAAVRHGVGTPGGLSTETT